VKKVNGDPAVEFEFDVREDEVERVRAWRLEELQRAGYERKMARTLAERSDVDLHLATALLRSGCPIDTALRILI
jgi:hypothetical protein